MNEEQSQKRLFVNNFVVNKKRHTLKIKPQYDERSTEPATLKNVPTYLEKFNGVVKEYEQNSYKVDISALWIDRKLDINSANPVENRAVTSAIFDIYSELNDLSSSASNQLSSLSTLLSSDYTNGLSTLAYNLNLSVQNIHEDISQLSVSLSDEIYALCVFLMNKIDQTSSYLFGEISNLCSYVEQLQNTLPISTLYSIAEGGAIQLTKKTHIYEFIDDAYDGKFPAIKAPTDITKEQITADGYVFEFEIEWRTRSDMIEKPASNSQMTYVWLNEIKMFSDGIDYEHKYFVKGRYDSRYNEVLLFCWRTI